MAKVVIDKNGNKRYYNDAHQTHREDGPAIISKWGSKSWYENGHHWANLTPNGELRMYTNDKKAIRATTPGGRSWKMHLDGATMWPTL